MEGAIKAEIGTSEKFKKYVKKQHNLLRICNLFLSAPDVYHAVAIMTQLNFARGNGYISFIAKAIGGIAKLKQPIEKKPQKEKQPKPPRIMKGRRHRPQIPQNPPPKVPEKPQVVIRAKKVDIFSGIS